MSTRTVTAIHSTTYVALVKLRMIRFQFDHNYDRMREFLVDDQPYVVDDRAPLNPLVVAIAKEYT